MRGMRFGPYELEALLARGGMGEVYRARDVEHGDRTVAVKLLPTSLSADAQYRARFRREAEHAARLAEPHIPAIHRYGEIDGRLFLDMEFVEGRTLAAAVADGPLEPARAVAVLGQVAAALDAAHADGLVHRDVKPANILLTEPELGGPEHAVLVDFGIATPVDPGSRTALTRTGAVIGTLYYMAPERFLAEPVGPTADVYSLACVLHELLTGARPFEGDGYESQVHGHLRLPPPSPSALRPDLPGLFDAVIAQGMAKHPSTRFASAGALARAASAALDSPRGAAAAAPGGPWPPTPTPTPTPLLPPPVLPVAPAPRRRGVLGAATAGVAVGAAALLVALLAGGGSGGGPGGVAAGPPAPPVAASTQPAGAPLTERTLVGVAPPSGAPEVAHLGGRPVIVLAMSDGSPVRVLDLATGEQLGAPVDLGSASVMSATATVTELDGQAVVVTGGSDGILRTWDLATGRPLATAMAGHTESVSALAAGETADGREVVASASYDDTVRLWDLRSGAPITGPLPGTTADPMTQLEIVQVDGRAALAAAGFGQFSYTWDLSTGAPVGTPLPGARLWSSGVPLGVLRGRAVMVAADDEYVGADLHRYHVHDLADGAATAQVTVHQEGAGPATLAEVDGRPLLLVANGREIQLHDLATGAPVGPPLTGHEADVSSLTVVQSGGSPFLLSAGQDRAVRIWDLRARSLR